MRSHSYLKFENSRRITAVTIKIVTEEILFRECARPR
jgi:hypothetical protein